MKTAIYLRKSRADEEKERYLGQGETLSIHRKELLTVAKIKNLQIVKIYEELESGESLLRRPAMLELLKEVEDNKYDAILCMDLQRLGRGDLEEQGMILKAFKKSKTLIITPDKVYDLNNEFDEEYSEFEAFMGRKEYKMINKRLQRGVIHSVKEGNYNGTYPPYGYDIIQDKKSRTLAPNAQADTIKMIFNWYANERVGGQIIADRLNNLGIKTNKGNRWSSNAIAAIIKNPLYIGKITWRKVIGRYTANKKKATKKRPEEEWIVVDGKHDPIIDVDTFKTANDFLKTHIKSPLKPKQSLINSLAGIVVCGVCGYKMEYRPYTTVPYPYLICRQKCGNKSSRYEYIEAAILKELKILLDRYKTEAEQEHISKMSTVADGLLSNLSALKRETAELYKQKDNLHDLLERGIYTTEVFLERSRIIAGKLDVAEEAILLTKNQLELEYKKQNEVVNVIPKLENVLSSYESLPTPDHKNMALKSIIEKVIYKKAKDQKNDNFEICINTRF
jgi:site-specific DNA recombinase